MKEEISLKQRIYDYLKKNEGVRINGGEIERLAMEYGYKASHGDRRARDLRKEGSIQSKVIDGSVWFWVEPQLKQLTII